MQLFDSRSKAVRPFDLSTSQTVRLYTCGITPNNATHLGHAFTYVSVDVLIRHLKKRGYKVDYLQNATDINDSDDVIKQAKEGHVSWQQMASHWIKHFHAQMDALGVVRPTAYVLATDVIPTIVSMITKLVETNCAYEVDGAVFFDVKKTPNYGAVCGLSKQEMADVSAARGADPHDPRKKDPLDFLLWKPSSEEPHWESPWGAGRPGWHIECSAMIQERFDGQVDIHAGGADLIYPHHESEIAQSECFTGRSPFSAWWMHVAMVQYENEKMSKSLGNLILVEDLRRDYDPMAIRYMLLSHHYRESWEYEKSLIKNAQSQWSELISKLKESPSGSIEIIFQHLDNDLDIPSALAYLKSECAGSTLSQGLKHLGLNISS